MRAVNVAVGMSLMMMLVVLLREVELRTKEHVLLAEAIDDPLLELVHKEATIWVSVEVVSCVVVVDLLVSLVMLSGKEHGLLLSA